MVKVESFDYSAASREWCWDVPDMRQVQFLYAQKYIVTRARTQRHVWALSSRPTKLQIHSKTARAALAYTHLYTIVNYYNTPGTVMHTIAVNLFSIPVTSLSPWTHIQSVHCSLYMGDFVNYWQAFAPHDLRFGYHFVSVHCHLKENYVNFFRFL